MKKICVCSLMIALVLSVLLCAHADALLPSEIVKVWGESNYKDWDIVDFLEMSTENEAFVSIRKGETNRLVHLSKNKSGEWKIGWSSESAFPQGDSGIYMTDRSGSTYGGIKLGTAFSFRPYRSGCYECVYQKHGSNWLLEEIIYVDTDGTLLDTYRITDDGVTYRGWLSNDRKTYIEGRVQRNLRYFSFSTFPTDLKALRNSLSNPPRIPTGTLIAEEVKFTGGKKYSVFSGPGENYLRGGNDKAAVSTNDWIQVFGKENGWIMIQYDITSDHMRIGWIEESAMPKNANVKNADFSHTIMHTAAQCTMTDDPLFSASALLTIPENSEVICLATMGSWAYVEWGGASQLVRGFVPDSYLTGMSTDQVKQAAISILRSADPALSEDALSTDAISYSYDTVKVQWTVSFSSGRNVYTVIVNDRTGTGWIIDNENG